MRAPPLRFLTAAFMATSSLLAGTDPGVSRDARVEEHLRRGRVTEAHQIGRGLTRPLRVSLEHQGRELAAAFKTVNIFRHQAVSERRVVREPTFSDSYRFERAAYLLDRALGLRMVPVVVLRRVRGARGAVIEWIDDAVTEHERRDRELLPDDVRVLQHQRSLMKLFDALILNTDRNLGNQLITPDDWRLHLIDHSRSFRLSSELPRRFLDWQPRLPSKVYARLRELDEEYLLSLLRGLVSRARVRALLARRDRIVGKIERERERVGDATVFGFRGPRGFDLAGGGQTDEQSPRRP